MAVNAAFRDHIADLFNPYGTVTFKRFFGGTGLYFKDRLFAFIMRDRVYMKTNAETRAAYEAEGAEPFTFKNAAGETIAIAYYELPARLHDDTDELSRWVRQAHEVATVPRGRKRAISKGKLPTDLPLLPVKKRKK